MFFDSWEGVLRVLVVGTSAYVALIALLRISGKRTLAKLNAFDFVVTVALGSTLATVLLTSDVALVEGVVAMALLVALQYVVAWSSVRSPAIKRIVKSEPTLLYRDDFLHDAMRRVRVTEDEIRQAARAGGKGDLGEVAMIVLETDGTLSVVGQESGGSAPGRRVTDGDDGSSAAPPSGTDPGRPASPPA